MQLEIATAPDSFGVWFAHDDKQMSWRRYLDDAADAGYRWTELGPLGYLPADARVLAPELEERRLRACGQAIMLPLEDPGVWPDLESEIQAFGTLLQALGARHLVLIDAMYTDLHSGARAQPRELDEAAWRRLVEMIERAAHFAQEFFGLRLAFHPHAETHVETEAQIERLLEETDRDLVRLCFDTGHHLYAGGDPLDFMRRHHDRVDYLHVKSVDPAVLAEARREALPFAAAVARSAFCELDRGAIDFSAFGELLREADFQSFVVVEQDMYPAPPDKPLPIARANRDYLRRLGWG
jgi:inosose dehydratase